MCSLGNSSDFTVLYAIEDKSIPSSMHLHFTTGPQSPCANSLSTPRKFGSQDLVRDRNTPSTCGSSQEPKPHPCWRKAMTTVRTSHRSGLDVADPEGTLLGCHFSQEPLVHLTKLGLTAL